MSKQPPGDRPAEAARWRLAATVDLRVTLLVLMTAGTALLACLLLAAMLRQPFEPNDDLIWFTKLRRQGFSDLPLSAAWMVSSPFYRPIAEGFLKGLYVIFGMNLSAYRIFQFLCFILLVGLGSIATRQLRLPAEASLALIMFCLGSPFLFGSIVWISELPHIVIVVCFAASLTIILSTMNDNAKLVLCGLAFAVAVLSKENGLALAVFSLYFLRKAWLQTALVFGGITVGYLGLRALVLGSSIGAGGVNESVGYMFDYLSQKERQAAFPGSAIYQLYLYNVTAQIGALLFRVAQWGILVSRISYEVVLHSASTALIVLALGMRVRQRSFPVWLIVLIVTVIGGTVFSYSYARDRHLALPAFAYGMLLVICCGEIGRRARTSWGAATLFFFVWSGWVVLAYRNISNLPGSSLEVVEKSYRPYPEVPNPQVDADIWQSAREQALKLGDQR